MYRVQHAAMVSCYSRHTCSFSFYFIVISASPDNMEKEILEFLKERGVSDDKIKSLNDNKLVSILNHCHYTITIFEMGCYQINLFTVLPGVSS